jgi:protein-histidine pros-kinase
MSTVRELVVVIDDDHDVSMLCRLQLEAAGFEVAEAHDGAGGLELAETRKPAAIVLDYMLPDTDGVEVLRRLAARPATADIPVIMLTARTRSSDQQAAWEAGVWEYLTKPFDGAVLVAAVRAATAPDRTLDRGIRQRDALDRLRVQDFDVLERLASIVEHSQDAIMSKTLDGIVTSWNTGAQRMYGYEAAEMIGRNVSILVPTELQDELAGMLQRLSQGELIELHETTRLRKDGHEIEVSMSLSPIKTRAGEIVGASVIARDITERKRAEERFHAIVEAAPDAIVIVDDQGWIQMANRQTEALFGYARDEIIGQPVEMLIPHRYRDQHPVHRTRYTAAPQAREMGTGLELTGLRKDGTEFPVEISLSPIQGERGGLVSAAIRDVTYRKRVENMFRGLLEAAPDAIVGVNRHGLIQLVNAQTEALFGYSREELIGQPVEILIPENHRRAHPGLRESYFAAPRTRPMGAGIDLVARRRDGTAFPAEISLSSIETDDGILVSAAIRDVTERKRAEQRFRGLVEAAPDAMVIVDRDGRIQLVNAQTERMFGYARDELLGRPVELLVPRRFRAMHPQHRSKYAAEPKPRPMGAGLELHGLRKDGTEFPVEISLSPMDDEHGGIISAAIRDVTERKNAERVQTLAYERERAASQRLREVDALRADFLSTVSHELRTPLTTIKGFADLLHSQWDEVPDAQRLELVGRISRAGGRLDSLIGDLLDFSRLERGEIRIDLRPLDLRTVVDNCVDRSASALERHQVVVDIPTQLPVLADESALCRVVENLLTNAAKFAAPGTMITVRGQEASGNVVLTVADQGPGIPQAELPRIFDRFYRVGGQTNKVPGTGIGLAIVKEFTEAQRGTVTVTSTLGEGTEFTVQLCTPRRTGDAPSGSVGGMA